MARAHRETLNMETPLINWHLLAEAVAYYKGKGYQYVEAPWTVRRDITEVTFPNAYEAMGAGEKDSVEDTIETYLIQKGFIEKTPRGRILTKIALNYLNNLNDLI